MDTNFLLRTLATPGQTCSTIVQMGDNQASQVLDVIQTLISLQAPYEGLITTLGCQNTTELLFLDQETDEAFSALPVDFQIGNYLPNLNTKMIVSTRGVHWEAWNEQVHLTTAILPINIIQFLAKGGSFVNKTGAQIIQETRSLYPVHNKGLFANH